MTFFPLFLCVQPAPEVGPTSYETPCIYKRTRGRGKMNVCERSTMFSPIRDGPRNT